MTQASCKPARGHCTRPSRPGMPPRPRPYDQREPLGGGVAAGHQRARADICARAVDAENSANRNCVRLDQPRGRGGRGGDGSVVPAIFSDHAACGLMCGCCHSSRYRDANSSHRQRRLRRDSARNGRASCSSESDKTSASVSTVGPVCRISSRRRILATPGIYLRFRGQ
jgi:hypothetical protein